MSGLQLGGETIQKGRYMKTVQVMAVAAAGSKLGAGH